MFRCNPPGLRRSESQCRVRRRQSELSVSSGQCHGLGLIPCSCPQHTNHVSHCSHCCHRPGHSSQCHPVQEWLVTMFDEIQHYLARLCWSTTVSACVSTAPKYSRLLSSLSRLRPGSGEESQVYCLRTGVDSNCWQLSVQCDNQSDKHYKSYNTFI